MTDRCPQVDRANRTARLIRGAWGAVLLIEPDLPLRLGGGMDSRGVRAAVRVLGARHLVEALILRPGRDAQLRKSIRAVDALHGSSMLVLASVSPSLRRDALLSAASATGLVFLSFIED